jgi:hypothetical protein
MAQLHPDDVYTVESLVRLLGLNRRTIERRLSGVPYEARGRSPIYRLGDACQAIVEKAPEPRPPGLTEALTRKWLAYGEKLRLEIENMQKRLIPREQVEMRFERECVAAHK